MSQRGVVDPDWQTESGNPIGISRTIARPTDAKERTPWVRAVLTLPTGREGLPQRLTVGRASLAHASDNA